MKKESILYKKLDNKLVQCLTCNHKCYIKPSKFGFCGVRKNIDGKLFNMFYGFAISENIDPIEKKPIYHYLTDTNTLTFASAGCNFCCRWCQNWQISQITKTHDREEVLKQCFEITPSKIVKDAILNQCPSISYSYTEPTIFLEYAYDTMKLAHEKGLKNIWVSNGYMTKETLELIAPYLDAINIDLKTFDNIKYQNFTSAKLDPIIANIKYIYKNKIHLELTTLVVTGVNDNKKELIKITQFIKNELDINVPWHITKYYPAYKMTNQPVSDELIHDILHMAKNLGLKNVYIGNV